MYKKVKQLKIKSYRQIKQDKIKARLKTMAHVGKKSAAKEQKRVSLTGGKKWKITNFKEVAENLAKWL